MDDFDELLRRAMEAEAKDGSDEFSTDDPLTGEVFSRMIDRMGSYGIAHIGSESRKKMQDAVEELQKELKDLDVRSSTTALAKAVARIRKSAKEIEVLNTIMASSSLVAMAMHTGNDVGSAIETVVKMMTL